MHKYRQLIMRRDRPPCTTRRPGAGDDGRSGRRLLVILCLQVLMSTAVLKASAQGLPEPEQPVAGGAPHQIAPGDYVDRGTPRPDEVALGRLLFFDKILSGNRDIACGTCHHPTLATVDALSLPVGTGGHGLGPERTTGDDIGTPIVRRMPRNALALFGMGHKDHTTAFFDGRVEARGDGTFVSPADEDLPAGLANIVAVTSMFPVEPHEEMSGEPGENPIADAAADEDFPAIWALLAERLRAIPDYVRRFRAVYGLAPQQITFADAANALAAFIIEFGRVLETPFARYATGDQSALSPEAAKGSAIFFGRGGCVECHSGPLFSDMDFHAIGMPQVGPGKAHGWLGREDHGREAVSGHPADRYRFRTPILLNVAHTGPYGHDGEFATLSGVIRHHNTPGRSLREYVCGFEDTGGQLIMPPRPDLDGLDCMAHEQVGLRREIERANELRSPRLSERDLQDLERFLIEGLTDQRSLDRLLTHLPEEVPSGLPVD